MITASHNPAEDNGFKIVCGREHHPRRRDPEAARAHREARAFAPTASRPGAPREHDILADYVDYVADNIKLGPRRFKVVVDGGNGTGGLSLLPILRAPGRRGRRALLRARRPLPQPPPRSDRRPRTWPTSSRRVQATGAEVGIALDGDADRIGAVDGQGRILWGDQLVILFAREILTEQPGRHLRQRGEVQPGAVRRDRARAAARAIMWKVGHSLIKAKMKEEKAALAGEMSGHMFFADRWFGFDDAVYAGAAPGRAADATPSRRWPSSTTRCRSCTTRPRSACPAPTTSSSRSCAAPSSLVPRALRGRRRRRRARHVPGRPGQTSAGGWCAPRTPARCW